MIPTFQQLSGMATPTAPRASLNGPSYQVVKFQANRPASVPTITAGIDLINALFQGEKLTRRAGLQRRRRQRQARLVRARARTRRSRSSWR